MLSCQTQISKLASLHTSVLISLRCLRNSCMRLLICIARHICMPIILKTGCAHANLWRISTRRLETKLISLFCPSVQNFIRSSDNSRHRYQWALCLCSEPSPATLERTELTYDTGCDSLYCVVCTGNVESNQARWCFRMTGAETKHIAWYSPNLTCRETSLKNGARP